MRTPVCGTIGKIVGKGASDLKVRTRLPMMLVVRAKHLRDDA
jgi:hypothetical protein